MFKALVLSSTLLLSFAAGAAEKSYNCIALDKYDYVVQASMNFSSNVFGAIGKVQAKLVFDGGQVQELNYSGPLKKDAQDAGPYLRGDNNSRINPYAQDQFLIFDSAAIVNFASLPPKMELALEFVTGRLANRIHRSIGLECTAK